MKKKIKDNFFSTGFGQKFTPGLMHRAGLQISAITGDFKIII